MNLLHLQYFYVVARENGFTNAARALRIQQPAISRMVKQLEESFGFALFERVGRNVQLTAQGKEVFQNCQKIFGEVEALQMSLGQISGECHGPLMLAASEPIASHYLPGLLKKYLAKYPKVYPQVFSGPASSQLDSIASGALEFGLFFHIPDLPEKLEIFKRIPFRYHLVVRKDLRRNKEVCESFIGSREIDDTSNRRFPTLERLRKDYPRARIKISSNNLTAHRQMVLEGLGVSILPEFLVKDDLRGGALADVFAGEKFQFDMKAVKRATAILSKNDRELLDM